MKHYICREQVCDQCRNKDCCDHTKCPVFAVPTIDIEIVNCAEGEWIITKGKNHECSLCHDIYHYVYPHCPSCGGKMTLRKENEE